VSVWHLALSSYILDQYYSQTVQLDVQHQLCGLIWWQLPSPQTERSNLGNHLESCSVQNTHFKITYLELTLSASMGEIWSEKHTAWSMDRCFSEPHGLLIFVMATDSILYVAGTAFYTHCVAKRTWHKRHVYWPWLTQYLQDYLKCSSSPEGRNERKGKWWIRPGTAYST